MENEKTPVNNNFEISEKRAWHSPELRKNTVRDDTKFEVGARIDGAATGSSSF